MTGVQTCALPISRRPGEVGIDLGIAQTVTLSDGTVFQLDVESIKKHEKQIGHT